MSGLMSSISLYSPEIFLFFLLFVLVDSTFAGNRHVIDLHSPNLFPEGVAWDSTARRFVVGACRQPSIHSVSDTGVMENLISDAHLPPNATVLGVTVDSANRRLLAVINAMESVPHFNALVAYDLHSGKRLFLAPLTDGVNPERPSANDVAVDDKGNSFVTNSAGNFIWKVSTTGEPSIFSRSPAFTSQPVNRDLPYSYCGLNGIAYISPGYLLVVQTNTGKMFRVNADDGTAKLVMLPKDLTWADGMAVRSDDVVVVVSHHRAWLLKSDDGWGEGVVYDEIALDVEKFASSVVVREEDDRVYVLYGHVDEGMLGNVEREHFSIEEIEFGGGKSETESVWSFVLIGLGLAYFLYWRFQMGQLVKNLNKKTA